MASARPKNAWCAPFPIHQGLAVGFVLLRVESLAEEGSE
jgi:hypothetical protein